MKSTRRSARLCYWNRFETFIPVDVSKDVKERFVWRCAVSCWVGASVDFSLQKFPHFSFSPQTSALLIASSQEKRRVSRSHNKNQKQIILSISSALSPNESCREQINAVKSELFISELTRASLSAPLSVCFQLTSLTAVWDPQRRRDHLTLITNDIFILSLNKDWNTSDHLFMKRSCISFFLITEYFYKVWTFCLEHTLQTHSIQTSGGINAAI